MVSSVLDAVLLPKPKPLALAPMGGPSALGLPLLLLELNMLLGPNVLAGACALAWRLLPKRRRSSVATWLRG